MNFSEQFSDMNSARQLYSASVRNSIIQMVLFVLERLCDAFGCVKSMVPSNVSVLARIFCSSASPNLCKSECVSGRPYSESSNAVTVPVFSYSKGIPRDIEHTGNDLQQHSDPPDSYGKTSPTWVVSSTAPRHATGNRALLSGLVTKHDMFVHAVDEIPMPVVAHGTAVTEEINLPNVCLVPGLTANLVSICQLVEMEYSVEIGSGMCYIRNSADGTIVGKAHMRNGGLYVLDFLKVPLGV